MILVSWKHSSSQDSIIQETITTVIMFTGPKSALTLCRKVLLEDESQSFFPHTEVKLG